jgi:hypothetical protein
VPASDALGAEAVSAGAVSAEALSAGLLALAAEAGALPALAEAANPAIVSRPHAVAASARK